MSTSVCWALTYNRLVSDPEKVKDSRPFNIRPFNIRPFNIRPFNIAKIRDKHQQSIIYLNEILLIFINNFILMN